MSQAGSNVFDALMGVRPRRLPAVERSVVVVQGRKLSTGGRVEGRLRRDGLLDGDATDDAADQAAELERVRAARAQAAKRARNKRYYNKPEVKARRSELEAQRREHRVELRKVWRERNREQVLAYEREKARRYRKDPARREAQNARAREKARRQRTALLATATPEQLAELRAKQRAYQKAWRDRNRERVRAQSRERARKARAAARGEG